MKPLQNEEPDQAVLTAAEANWHRLAGIIDQRLIGQRWLCGNSVTIAEDRAVVTRHTAVDRPSHDQIHAAAQALGRR